MAQTIGTIIVVILALVVISAVLKFALGLIGIVFLLIPFLIKLAIIVALCYFGLLVFRKLTRSSQY